MKMRDILMKLPTASVVGQLPPALALLAGSDNIDFCIELFDKSSQPVLFQALNGNGVAIPGTGLLARIAPLGVSQQKLVFEPVTGKEPAFPEDWLSPIHSTHSGNVLIWVGEICAAKKAHIDAQLQADISNYDRMPGGWRRR